MFMSAGCVVPQPSGNGITRHLAEPVRDAAYYLYLPEGYRPTGRLHPLVVTFHGMKPFDSASAQVREWQSEADRYGYVVVAPVLRVSCAYGPFPLDRLDPWLLEDESNVLAVMDDVTRTVNVDPANVLVSSWSYGGYIAHYMLNRHPERFSCLAVKQSNFNASILDPETVPRYAHVPIAIFGTSNDFRQNKVESQAAALWYVRHGFDVTTATFRGLGHARTPGPAAAFFARHCGAKARSAPWELAWLQLDHAVTLNDLLPVVRARREKSEPTPPAAMHARPSAMSGRQVDPTTNPPTSSRAVGMAASPPGPTTLSATPTASTAATSVPGRTIGIHVSPGISITPLNAEFRALVPPELRQGARYQWFINDRPLSGRPMGKCVLVMPGDYELRLKVADRTGRIYEATRKLTVLDGANKEK